MFLGTFILGQFVPLTVQCRTGAGVPVAPAAAPVLSIYSAGSDTPVVDGISLPPKNKPTRTGGFEIQQRLTSAFAVGHYTVRYQWTSTSVFARTDTFEVVAGGDSKGANAGIEYYPRPDSSWIVTQGDGGTYSLRRNPSLRP